MRTPKRVKAYTAGVRGLEGGHGAKLNPFPGKRDERLFAKAAG